MPVEREAPVRGLVEIVELLAPASKFLEGHDVRELQRVQVIAKDFMVLQARQFCENAGSKPVMCVYGSDMTPMLLAFRQCVQGSAKHARIGRRLCEWLLHQAYFIAPGSSSGEYECRTLFESPVLMASKKAWYSYACAARLIPILKDWHSQGISLSWYIFDRGAGPVGKLLRMRHLVALSNIVDPIQRELASLTDWVDTSFCGDHDVQNGLCKACMFGFPSAAEVCKTVFKAIRSIRDVMDKLIETLPAWIEHLDSTDTTPFDYEELLQCWVRAGAKADLAKELAEINLRFEDGRLVCHTKVCECTSDVATHVAGLVMRGYVIRTFSISRFRKLCSSCCGLSVAFMLGLDAHLAFARPVCSEYYLHCYDGLKAVARHFVLKASILAQCTDKLLLMLLEDDRIALDPERYFAALHTQLEFVNSTPALLFKRLAKHSESLGARLLESDCLQGCYQAASYIDRRFFATTRDPVNMICVGDVQENLRRLKDPASPAPSAPTLWKAQRLLRMGWPLPAVEEALNLRAQAPRTTLKYEQQHGRGAAQHKHHANVVPETHAVKTGAQALLPMIRASNTDPPRFAEDRTLGALRKQVPERGSAQSSFMKESMRRALDCQSLEDKATRKKVAQTVVKKHQAAFASLPQETQRKYTVHAGAEASRKRKDLDANINKLESVLAEKRLMFEMKQRAKTPMCAAKYGWSKLEVDSLEETFLQSKLSLPLAESARAKELHCPQVPVEVERKRMLEAYDNSGEECLLAVPAWISTVCRHREHFANVALVFGEPPLAPMFVLGHASQNPFWVSMLQLRPCRSGSASSTDTDIVVQPRAAHFYSMKVDHSRFYFEDEEHFALPPAQIIPFLTFETKNLAWSDCPAVPYREFVANLPVPAPRAQKPKKDPLALDDEVKERLQPHRRIIGKSSVASVPAAVADPDASARVEDVEFKDLVQAMADEDLVPDPGDEHDEADFIVRPYRGHNSGRKQSTLDSFRAEARGLQERMGCSAFSAGLPYFHTFCSYS